MLVEFPHIPECAQKMWKNETSKRLKHIDAKNKINKKIARERENSRKFAHIRINKRLRPRIFRDRLSITGDQRVVGKSENRHRVLFILLLFSPPFYLFFRIVERLVVGEGGEFFIYISWKRFVEENCRRFSGRRVPFFRFVNFFCIEIINHVHSPVREIFLLHIAFCNFCVKAFI